jgi:PDGLE domain
VSRASLRVFTIVALALAVGLATAVSPYASSSPDGLEKVAAEKAFAAESAPAPIQDEAPAADYGFPGVRDARLATGLAGFAGTLLVFGLGYGTAALARRRRGAA